MKARYFSILAVAVLLASCAKEALTEKPEITTGKTVLTVGVAPQTMVSMGPADAQGHRQLFWSDGDQIAVNGVTSAALENVEAECTSVDFTFDDPLTTPYNVLYPASIYTDENHVTLPASQKYKEGGIADGVLPMAGYSADGSSITVSSLCAIVKIQVKRAATSPDEDNLVAVRFQGRNGEQVSGEFTIDYQNGTLTSGQYGAADEVVRAVKNLATSTGAPCVYHVVVPARTYSQGFDVIVQDVNGHVMTKSKTASITLEAGHMYTMPEFEFVPTATELGVEINSAQDLIDFATAYNNKVFDSDLVATLTSDINFDATSSAAFNATGGIGLKIAAGDTEDYYFNGVFEGDNHTISGLEATVPIFTATGDGGVVRNLTVDNSCVFSFTHGNAAEADLGSVVGYHKGLLKGVTSNADVSIAAGDITQVTALGGLVGRITIGSVEDCIYAGDLVVPAEFSVTGKLTHIGGLVGEITNAAGVIKDSDFNGTLETEARVSSTDKNNPYLFVGGIVGSVAAGTVSNCNVTATSTKEVTMANETAYTGTLFNHTTLAYHMAQGGVAGQNAGTVENCTNLATTQNFVLTTGTSGTAADANSRYYDLGGIVGLNKASATVSGCINEGLIESRSTPRIQKVGGVVGYNLGTVSSCSNSGNLTFASATGISPYNMRVGEVGGVIGNNDGTVSEISNSGNIALSRTENAAGVELKFGGVIGLTTKAINGGAGKSISNSGNILDSYNGTTVTTAGLRFGGVVGSAQASVQNVTNTGKVTFQTSSTNVVSFLYMGGIVGEVRSAGSATISGCENEGEVYFYAANNAAHTDNYTGGILGKTFESDVTISDCSNSGYIHGGNPTKQNGKTMFVGGIVAYLDGASSIEGCTNTGVLWNNQFNNTVTKVGSTFEGGIAGFVLGTADNRISISNVTNNHDSGATITGGRRGYNGGAVGYGEYVDITNASNANGYGGGSGYYIGGIAGWLVNSTATNCTFSGTSIESSQVQGVGGIVCTLDAGTVLDGCYSYLTTITHGANACVDGDVAAKSVAGSTIKNCHYTDTYGLCSDSNFTNGGGNVADL
ncbi:MAG: hypothetical protein IJR01_02470 [Bacteroidales bacterium]|nr:hypothetical protein [Bacteroidales bacterium]